MSVSLINLQVAILTKEHLVAGLRIRVFGFSGFRVGLGKTRVGSEFGRAGYEFKARNSRATRAFGRPSKLGQVRAARVSRASSGARNSENDSTRQVTPSFSTNQTSIFSPAQIF